MKKLLTTMMMVLCMTVVFAQAPEKFSYQAVVRNTTNQLVTNAPVGVRVSILQGSAEGEAVYVETHTAATNANGLLTVEIGGGKAEQGSFGSISWADGPYFLKTETDPDGGGDYSITSVQQLLSVPYALYAKEAANGFSGDYNDLKNKPAIPQNVGDLPNDAGYITLGDLPSQAKGAVNDAGVVQTTACGEVDLCEMASQLARLQTQFARQQAQMEETQNALLSTVDDSEPCPGTPTVKDIDGNVYNTVKIGEQCWMRENLRTTRYADGSPISAGGSNTSTTDPYYYDFPSSGIPLEKRGYLYNWPAAMHGAEYSETNPSNVQGICPDGWHLPSNAEWTQLTDYVGNIPDYVCNYELYYEVDKQTTIIKALSDTSGWGSQYYGDSECGSCAASFNPSTNNATGFSALPTGLWYEGFGGGDAWFWSTSFSSDGGGASFTMQFNCVAFVMANEYVGEYGAGFSVRCLRGSATVEETSITVPSVTTSEVSEVSDVSAVCGGEVTDDGGAEVTERGVCWGTEPNPTVEGSHTSDGTGTGEFVSTLTDLVPNTNYYVRAYATNSVGTVYGEVMMFTTTLIPAGDAQPCPGNETVTDYDGNVYNTVKIGEQCWMKENLRVTHYADGVEIPDGNSTSFDIAYRYNPGNDANNVSSYGLLYNWPAVMHGMSSSDANPSNIQGVCPAGWHVPSISEWDQLNDYVSSVYAYTCGGNIAKSLASTTGWDSSDIPCTPGYDQDQNNATGFSALPATCYGDWCGICEGSSWCTIGSQTNFWSTTNAPNFAPSAYSPTITYNLDSLYRYGQVAYNRHAYSVRCILGDGYNFAAVTTKEVTNVTLHGATCGGDVTYDGNTDVTERGVCWSTEPNPTLEDSHTSNGTGTGEFVCMLINLTPNTTYYVKAYATNSVGTVYGEDVSFTTADTCDIQTLPYTADFEGYTTSTSTSTGVQPACWELVHEDVAMTDANRPQLYYKSSYAHSGNYSLLLNYRGIYAMPVVSQQIPLNTLKMEMYLRQPRDYYQLQVGVWEDNGTFVPVATVHNASTGTEFVEVDFSGYTGDGGRIAFRNLNSNGNNYSYNYLDDITLSIIGGAVVDEKSCPHTLTVTDYEGNVYATVQIGEQCWMRENLRTTHYADGTAIPVGGDNSYTEPYYYDYSSHCLPVEKGGYLYNWPAAMVACPTGWHLPSDAEWTQLENYVGSQSEYACGGSSSSIAKALASTEGWIECVDEEDHDWWCNDCCIGVNSSTNNATGFSAVPAGDCYHNYAWFWSSTHGGNTADGCYLSSNNNTLIRYGNYKNYGVSVRCLRDETGGGSISQTLPAVTTGNLSDVTLNSAVCGSEVTVDGGAEVTERGVCWSTEPNPTVEDDHTSDGAGTGIFSSSITGLTAGTTYYVRAYATNSVGTAYGEEVSFTTAAEQPQDTCATITLPYSENFDSYTTSTTASTGVEPTCWELVQEDVTMTDATRPQLYYKNSFAHSGNYSLKMGYRCVYAMPALSADVQMNQVKLEMYLRQANAAYQLEVGVWDDATRTFERVQLVNNSTTNVEHVTCDFSNYMGNGRRIAFRNVLGGGANYNYSYNYIDDITLSTIFVVDEKSCPNTPTVTDHEGNVYATVQIGNQCWMRDNLRTTTSPSTGTYLIPAVDANYTYTGKQAFWYNNDSATYAPMNYGLLYNWNAAVDTFNTAYGETSVNTSSSNAVSTTFNGHRRGICPVGWHLPSDAEWTQLENYVGSHSYYTCGGNSSCIAKALASTEGWETITWDCVVGNDPSSNNATGFSVVPAGYCGGSSFDDAFNFAIFWSATQDYSDGAYSRLLYYNGAGVSRSLDGKGGGRSVRCLRD